MKTTRQLRFLCGAVTLLLLTLTADRLAAADAYRLSVVTDRKAAIYETGADATFQVTVTQGDKPVTSGRVVITIDDFVRRAKPVIPPQTITLDGKPIAIRTTLKTPGFLRCRVVFVTPDKKRLQASVGAAFSPTKIRPSLPVPDDFDKFWAAEKKKLAAVPMNPKVTPVKTSRSVMDCFDVQVACLGGAPVSGYLAKPPGAKPKSLPAILWVHGAGVRGSSLGNAIGGAANGMLSMDINAHGIPNGKPADFYRKLSAGKLRNYRYAGRKSRETIYFRGMFLRLVRAIDFLTSQPEWDGKTVIVIGHSQGGGQALAAGGIDSRVTMIATGVPAICDHTGVKADRVNGWPKLVPNDANGKPDAEVLQASRYVDAVNFAARCKAEAIMSVGFIDGVCPPSSCYAAYNVLKGSKQVINNPAMGHAAPALIKGAFFKAVLEHVRKQSKK